MKDQPDKDHSDIVFLDEVLGMELRALADRFKTSFGTTKKESIRREDVLLLESAAKRLMEYNQEAYSE